MQVGDLVRRKPYKLMNRDDGFGFIIIAEICKHRGWLMIFVRFPLTGWSQWFHPTRLEVISEA